MQTLQAACTLEKRWGMAVPLVEVEAEVRMKADFLTFHSLNRGALNCGGALTYGGNSISMTDGTGAFSVTATMMRVLYSHHTHTGLSVLLWQTLVRY